MDATITLPKRDEMLRRLNAVDNGARGAHGLYPHIAKAAGQYKTAMGIVMLIHLAIADYAAGLPAIMGRVVATGAHRYVEALVDDEAVRAEALRLLAEVAAT